jgi:hypothetical protein
MIVPPPVSAGAAHDSADCALSTVAVNAVGADAAAWGMTIVVLAVPKEFTPPTVVIGVTRTS